MFGDAGVPNSDASYTGSQGAASSVFSLDYYRGKALQFQEVLNAVDQGAQAAAIALQAPDVDGELQAQLQAALEEFAAKKGTLVTTAEAINLGAEAVNAVGGRFPELSIPTGLGFLPALPVAAVAAIGVAAALVIWGRDWLMRLKQLLAQINVATLPDDQKAQVLQALAQADAAEAAANESPLSSIASIVKWGAIGFGVYLAWQALSGRMKG